MPESAPDDLKCERMEAHALETQFDLSCRAEVVELGSQEELKNAIMSSSAAKVLGKEGQERGA